MAFARNGDPNTSRVAGVAALRDHAPARDGARRRVPRHRRPRRRHPSALARHRQRLRIERGDHPRRRARSRGQAARRRRVDRDRRPGAGPGAGAGAPLRHLPLRPHRRCTAAMARRRSCSATRRRAWSTRSARASPRGARRQGRAHADPAVRSLLLVRARRAGLLREQSRGLARHASPTGRPGSPAAASRCTAGSASAASPST